MVVFPHETFRKQYNTLPTLIPQLHVMKRKRGLKEDRQTLWWEKNIKLRDRGSREKKEIERSANGRDRGMELMEEDTAWEWLQSFQI